MNHVCKREVHEESYRRSEWRQEVDERIIVKHVLQKYSAGEQTEYTWLWISSSGRNS
jgi:hypothetical protein